MIFNITRWIKNQLKHYYFFHNILILILFIYTHKVMLIYSFFFPKAMPSLSFAYLVFSHLYLKEEENSSQFKKTAEWVVKL